MLLGGERGELHRIAFAHRRQHVIGIVRGQGVIGAFLVHRHVAGLHQRRAVGAQQVTLRPVGPGEQVHGDGVEQRVTHLRGNCTLPDQGVEAREVILDLALHVRRRDRRRGGADGLVRLLCILRLGLVDARLLRDLLLTVKPRGHCAYLAHRFGGERHRVGAHVGDEPDAAFAQILALVQLLRETHGAPGIEAELAGRLLLQRRGGEGRGRIAAALLAIDREHAQLAAASGAGRRADGALDLARFGFVGEAELLDLAAAILQQLQREGLRAVRPLALDGPVLLRQERADLLLALADHAQRRALHAPRRQSAAHLLPQERGEIEADQVVERAARLLGVDELERQSARLPDRRADGVARDFVEHHAMHVLAVEIAARLQDLLEVPGDRLALAIRVGRQIQRLRLVQRARDGLDVPLVLVEQLVLHPKAVVGIDRALLGHQVTHVPVGGEHLEIAAQILLDRLGLGGRFDYDQIVCHELGKNTRA